MLTTDQDQSQKIKSNHLYLKRMVEAGRDAGCMESQVVNFMAGGYVPLPVMWSFHAACRECDHVGGPSEVGLGGTRYAAKSHTALAQIALDDCQRVPGVKALWLRKIKGSATESLEDLTDKVLKATTHSQSRERIDFENGSRILVGGYKDERDIDKYLGIEYDIVAIEEATMISEERRNRIHGSCRSSRPNWRARLYYTTNPDGIGLRWFKERMVIPWRKHKETTTRFFNVNWRDNPFLQDNYKAYLLSLTGPLKKAWCDGDWDAFEGMAFPTWNADRHVIPPRELAPTWILRRSIDWGLAAPFACLWVAHDPDTTRRYYYREVKEPGLHDRAQAQLIKQMTPESEHVRMNWCDPTLITWRKNAQPDGKTITTISDEYKKEGIILTGADNDRINSKRKIDRMLADLPDGEPGLLVFDTCTNFISDFPALVASKKNPEDVDTDQDDHLYDCARYDATDLPSEKQGPPPNSPKVAGDRWAGLKNV